jgi:HEAT repeat protein
MSSTTSDEHDPGTLPAVEQFLREITATEGETVRHELLSDLDRAGAQRLEEEWERVPPSVRAQMVRDMVEDAERNIERSYSRVMRIAIRDPHPATRIKALDGLWEHQQAELVGDLLDMLSSESDDSVRAALVMALAPYSQRAEIADLEESAAERLKVTLLNLYHEDSSATVRRRALESVGYFSDAGPVATAIREAYESGSFAMQVSALRAMGHQADARWLPLCYGELKSDEPEIRFEAVTAIGSIMDERSSSRIVDMIADDDAEVRLAAISALGSIGGPIAINALRRLVQEEEDELLIDAAEEALEEALLMENPLRPPHH